MAFLLGIGAVAAADFAWIGATDGNWDDAARWQLTGGVDADGIPDADDTVTIPASLQTSVTITLDDDRACQSFTLAAGGGLPERIVTVTLSPGTSATAALAIGDGTFRLTTAQTLVLNVRIPASTVFEGPAAVTDVDRGALVKGPTTASHWSGVTACTVRQCQLQMMGETTFSSATELTVEATGMVRIWSLTSGTLAGTLRVGRLLGDGLVTFHQSAGTPTIAVGGDGASGTFAGKIGRHGSVLNTGWDSGAIGLMKEGAGTWTLSGTANDFRGANTGPVPAIRIYGGTVVLTGELQVNPTSGTQSITVDAGNTFRITGDSGRILPALSTPWISLGNEALLEIDGTGIADLNRINDGTRITSVGGTVRLIAPATAARTETVGQFDLNSGTTTVDLQPGATGDATLTVSSITRLSGSDARLHVIRGVSGGSGVGRLYVSSGLADGELLPWCTVLEGGQVAPARYTVADGIVAVPATIVSNGTGGGPWVDGGTWVGGVAPGAADTVIIRAGDTVAVGGASAATNLILQGDAALTGAGALTVSGLVVADAAATPGIACGLGGGASPLSIDALPGSTVTVTGAVTGTGGVTKSGTGTLSLGGANSWSGGLTINNGSVLLGGANTWTGDTYLLNTADTLLRLLVDEALPDSGTLEMGPSQGGQWVLGATLDLDNHNETVGNLLGKSKWDRVLFGDGAMNRLRVGSLNASTGSNDVYAGFMAQDVDDVIEKVGTGLWMVRGSENVFRGEILVSAGILHPIDDEWFGTADPADGGTTVSTGARLILGSGIGDPPASERLVLSGHGPSADGALSSRQNSGYDLNWRGPIVLDGDTSFEVINGENTRFNAMGGISGTGHFTKLGSGTLTLRGACDFIGVTTVAAGRLSLFSGASLTSGTGLIRVLPTASLEVRTGSVTPNPIHLGGILSTRIAGTPAIVSGPITLIADATLTDYSGVGDARITGAISGPFGLTRTSSDSTKGSFIELAGANTYTGATTVTSGILRVGHGSGLGSTAAGTSVAAGARLELDGGIAIPAETVVFNDTAASTVGMLRSLSGNNSIAGTITIAGGAATVGVDADTLTLTGGIAESGGAQPLTKLGAGTLALGCASSHTGSTTVSAGTLRLVGDTGTLLLSPTLTIAGGATFAIEGSGAPNPDRIADTAAVVLSGTSLNAATFRMSAGSAARTEDVGTITIGDGRQVIDLRANAGNAATLRASDAVLGLVTLATPQLSFLRTIDGATPRLLCDNGIADGTDLAWATVDGTSAEYRTADGVVPIGGAQRISNGTGGGLWSDGATWVGGVAPVDGDAVVIRADDVVTLGADAAVGSLAFQGGAPQLVGAWTLTIGDGTLTVEGGCAPTVACSLAVAVSGLVVDHPGPQTLTIGGPILASVGTVWKPGAGTIVWTHDYSVAPAGFTALQLQAGTIRMGAANALPAAVTMTMSPQTVLDLDNHDLRIGRMEHPGSNDALAGRILLGDGVPNTFTFGDDDDVETIGWGGVISGTDATDRVRKVGTSIFVPYQSGYGDTYRGDFHLDGGQFYNMTQNAIQGAFGALGNGEGTVHVAAGTIISTRNESSRHTWNPWIIEGDASTWGPVEINGPVTVNPGVTLTVGNRLVVLSGTDDNAGSTAQFRGALQGSGTVVVDRSGRNARFHVPGTFTGTMQLVAGTLRSQHAQSFGTAALAIEGGTLEFMAGVNGTTLASIACANTCTITALDAFALAPPLTLADGAVCTATISHLVGTMALGAGSTLDLKHSDCRVSGAASGGGRLQVTAGAGNRCQLLGGSTHTGGVRLVSGTTTLAHAAGLGDAAGTLELAGGTFASDVPRTIANPLLISSGTTNTIGGGSALVFSSTATTTATVTLIASAPFELAGPVTIGAGTTFSLSGNALSPITISGALQDGNGALTINSSTVRVILSGDNAAWDGQTTVTLGTLELRHANALGDTAVGTTMAASNAAIELSGGITLAAEPLSVRGTGIGGAGALRSIGGANAILGTVNLLAATTVNVSAGSLDLQGAVTQSAAYKLTCANAGGCALILTGNGGWTGGTDVTGGILRLGASDVLPNSGTLTVSAGATIDLAGFSDTIERLSGAGTILWGQGGTNSLTSAYSPGGSTTLTFSGTFGAAGTADVDDAFVKGGNGNYLLQLTGANADWPGIVTVSGGALEVQHASALGATAVGTTVASGAALRLAGGITIAEPITISGTGISTTGALRGFSGDNTLTGVITMAANASIGVNQDSLTCTNTITGGFTFTKYGNGTLILSAANDYTGTTTVADGVLRVAHGSALGTTAANTAVSSGGTLELASGIDIGSEPVTINGGGEGGIGALHALGGATRIAANVALTGAATIAVDADTLTFASTMSGGFVLTKAGAGELRLEGASSSGSSLTISGGTFTLAGDTGTIAAMSGATVGAGATLKIDGTGSANPNRLSDSAVITLNSGTVEVVGPADGVNHRIETIGQLVVNSGASTIRLTSAGGWNAGLLASHASLGFARSSGATLAVVRTMSGIVPYVRAVNGYADRGLVTWATVDGQAAMHTAADGLVPYSAAPATYTSTRSGDWGDATLWTPNGVPSAGDLVVIAADHSVDTAVPRSCLSLQFLDSGAVTASAAGTLTPAAIAISGAGTPALAAPVPVTAGLLAIDHQGTGAFTISGVISGASGLAKRGSGTAVLSGVNTFTGTVAVDAGVLRATDAAALGTSAGGCTVADGGTLEIAGVAIVGEAATLRGQGAGGIGALRGGAGGGSWSGTVALAADAGIGVAAGETFTVSGVVSGSAVLTKAGTGTLVLTTTNTWANGTAIAAGTLQLGSATTIANTGTVTVAAGATLDLAGYAETIGSLAGAGTVVWGAGGVNTFTVGVDNATTVFSGQLCTAAGQADATDSLVMNGTGMLTLSGDNGNFPGLITVTNGILAAAHANALGDTAVATTIGSGQTSTATLLIDNGYTLNEPVTLSGVGSGNLGALRSLSGTTTVAAVVTIQGSGSHARLGVDAGTMILNGGLGGGGNMTKVGSGTLRYTAVNTHSNQTIVDAGSVVLVGDTATLASATGVIVNQGGTFEIDGTGSANPDRIDATRNITLNGGTLRITGPASGATARIEAINTLVIASGASAIVLDAGTAGAGCGLTASTASITAGATLAITRTPSSTACTVKCTSLTNGAFLPWASVDGLLAMYSTADGIVPLTGGTTYVSNGTGGGSWTDTTTWAGGVVTTPTSADDVIITGTDTVTLPSAQAARSLAFDGAGTLSGAFALTTGRIAVTGTGSPTISANVTISTAGSNTVLAIDHGGTGTLTISGIIGSGATGIAKTGSGLVSLDGANTFTGAIGVSGGTLRARNNTALGSTGGGVTVADGATLEVANGISVGSEALTLNGTGVGGGGALVGGTGGAAWSGAISLSTDSAIAVANGEVLTISAVISQPAAPSPAMAMTKLGAGTLRLGNAATYTGGTTIQEGTLQQSGGTNRLSSSGAVTVAAGATLDLNSLALTIASLSGSGRVLWGTGGANAFTVNGSASTTFSGQLCDAAGQADATDTLVKNGTGTLTLSGDNANYPGIVTISGGVVAIAHGNALGSTAVGTTVPSNTALEILGGITVAENLIINGGGVGGTGVLRSVGGANRLTGSLTMNANSTIGVDAGSLAIAGSLGQSGGNRTLAKVGSGTLRLEVVSTHAGSTTVSAGTLELAGDTGSIASSVSPLTIQSGASFVIDGTGSANLNRLIDGGTVTLNSGTFAITGPASGATARTETIATLSVNGPNCAIALDRGVASAGAHLLATSGFTTAAGASLAFTRTPATTAVTVKSGSSSPANGAAIPWATVDGGAASYTTANGLVPTSTISASAYVSTRDGDWSDATMWSPNGVPTAVDDVTIAAAHAVAVAGAQGARSIAFAGSGSITDAGTLTVSVITVPAGATPGIAPAVTIGTSSLSVTVGANGTLAMTGAIGGSGAGLTKSGAGLLRLAGPSTYDGAVAIEAGTVVAAHATAFGSTAGGVTVLDGTTLRLEDGAAVGAEALSVTGAGMGGGGSLVAGTGGGSWAGAVTLAGSATWTADPGETLAVSGAIGGGTTITLTTTGGTIELSGASGFTGAIDHQGGTLRAKTLANALGATNAASICTVASGATVELDTVPGLLKQLKVAGTGVGGGGAIRNVAGASSLAATTTLLDAATIAVPAGSLQANGKITGAYALTVAAGAASPLILANATNDWSGGTQVTAGVLRVGIANGIPNAGTVTLDAGAVLDLDGISEGIGGLSGGGAILWGTGGANTLTVGNSNLGGTFDGELCTAAGQADASDGFTKTGSGTLTLTAAQPDWPGVVTVGGGTLAIADAGALGDTAVGTTVTSGSLQLASGLAVGAEPLSLAGAGSGSAGALRATGGASSWAGTVTLATSTVSIGVDGGSLTLSSALATSAIGLAKVGVGELALAGDNATAGYTGAITVSVGSLRADHVGALGTVDGSTTVSSGASLLVPHGSVFALAEPVTLNGSGATGYAGALVALGDATLPFPLTLASTGTALELRGTVALTATPTTLAITSGSNGTHTIVATGGAVTVDAAITGTSGRTLAIDALGGSVALDGDSSAFAGSISVLAGRLLARHANALGATSAGTTVASGAELRLDGGAGIAFAAEPIVIAGDGTDGLGALRNAAGANSWGGTCSWTSAASIGVDAGTLTATGGFTSVLDLVKRGAGILGLTSPANRWGPAAQILAGTIEVGNAAALPPASAVAISAGAVLDVGDVDVLAGSVTGAGTVALGTGTTVFTVGLDGAATTFAGDFTGAATAGVDKAGAGALTLSGQSTCAGPWTVSAGDLRLTNGAGSATGTGGLTVRSGGTLSGTGATTAAVQLLAGGRIEPGASGYGRLTVGALDCAAGSTVALAVGGAVAATSHDQLVVTAGPTALGGATLETGPGYAATIGDTAIIVRCDHVAAPTGTFASLAQDAATTIGGETWRIVYDGGTGNDVALIRMPGVAIADATIAEPQPGPAPVTLTLTLSEPAPAPTTVAWQTVDGNAIAGRNYVAASGTASFGVGDTTTTITVDCIDDGIHRGDVAFTVVLSSPSGAVITDASATVTITNATPPLLAISWAAPTTGSGEGDTSAVTWALPPLAAGAVRSTDTAGTDAVEFVVRNHSSVAGRLTATASSAQWTLGATAGPDRCVLGISRDDGGTWTSLDAATSPTGVIVSPPGGVAVGATAEVDLRLQAPTATASAGAARALAVTITVAAE